MSGSGLGRKGGPFRALIDTHRGVILQLYLGHRSQRLARLTPSTLYEISLLNPTSKHTPAPVTLGRDVSLLGKALRRQGNTPPVSSRAGRRFVLKRRTKT